MKILTKNKIVDAFHFPFTEALIFSILLWTFWGLAESFYLDRVSGMLSGDDRQLDSLLYLEAFLIYAGVAAFTAILIYVGMRIVLASFNLHTTRTFRAYTLCGILIMFFAAALFHCLRSTLWQGLSTNMRLGLLGLLVFFSILLLVLLYRWASGEDFRIRRSGTMMLSILIISVVLSFVPFPIFAGRSNAAQPQKEAYKGYRQLMAYQYLAPLLSP